jgi:simple sugar transport system permease protein
MLGSGTLANASSTEYIPENSWLSQLGFYNYSGVTVAVYIAIALAVAIAVLLYKTNFGYEIKICGANPKMARYGGINAGRIILLAMILSGAIAGAAGAIEILGVHHRFQMRFSNQVGFDGVVVSLLANNNPIGVMFTAFFFGALKNGAMTLQRIADVPSALIDIVRGIIIFTISLDFAVFKLKKRLRNNNAEKQEQNIRAFKDTAPINTFENIETDVHVIVKTETEEDKELR